MNRSNLPVVRIQKLKCNENSKKNKHQISINFVRTRRTKFYEPEQPPGCEDSEIEVQRK